MEEKRGDSRWLDNPNEHHWALYHVFRRDHWFANPNPDPYSPPSYSKIDYDPHNHPEIYLEQVIHLAQIDKMSGALLKSEPCGKLRVMSFPEFSGASMIIQRTSLLQSLTFF
jgi:hypothetical protein